jgi:hypothetical protein
MRISLILVQYYLNDSWWEWDLSAMSSHGFPYKIY